MAFLSSILMHMYMYTLSLYEGISSPLVVLVLSVWVSPREYKVLSCKTGQRSTLGTVGGSGCGLMWVGSLLLP